MGYSPYLPGPGKPIGQSGRGYNTLYMPEACAVSGRALDGLVPGGAGGREGGGLLGPRRRRPLGRRVRCFPAGRQICIHTKNRLTEGHSTSMWQKPCSKCGDQAVQCPCQAQASLDLKPSARLCMQAHPNTTGLYNNVCNPVSVAGKPKGGSDTPLTALNLKPRFRGSYEYARTSP